MINETDIMLSQLAASSRILELVCTSNGNLIIEENQQYRWIRDNNNAYYSVYDKLQAERLVLPYLQSMMTVLLFSDEPKNTLLLGAGGAALLRFLVAFFPNNCITALDSDIKVIEMTQKYFMSENSNKYPILNVDAMSYITNYTLNNFDLIFVDLFSNGSIPKLFSDIMFYKSCLSISSSGITVFNLIVDSEKMFKKIMSLILFAFDNKCLCLVVDDYKNIIVLAFGANVKMENDINVLQQRSQALKRTHGIDFNFMLDNLISSNVSLRSKTRN